LALSLFAAGAEPGFSTDDVPGRLADGKASLNARGLISDDGQSLSADLAAVVQTVARPAFTLYLRKNVAGLEDGLAMHHRGDAIVAQQINGYVHTLTLLDSPATAADVAAAFLGIDTAAEQAATLAVSAGAQDALASPSAIERGTAALYLAGLAGYYAGANAPDTPALRGNFLRVDYSHGHPTTRRGATVVGTPPRLWLLRPNAIDSVQIKHLTIETLHDELDLLSRL
jgi:hypothetical protein